MLFTLIVCRSKPLLSIIQPLFKHNNLQAKDGQGGNINKNKAIVVRYDVDTVDPKRKRCRCFCPPKIT